MSDNGGKERREKEGGGERGGGRGGEREGGREELGGYGATGVEGETDAQVQVKQGEVVSA